MCKHDENSGWNGNQRGRKSSWWNLIKCRQLNNLVKRRLEDGYVERNRIKITLYMELGCTKVRRWFVDVRFFKLNCNFWQTLYLFSQEPLKILVSSHFFQVLFTCLNCRPTIFMAEEFSKNKLLLNRNCIKGKGNSFDANM